MTPGRKPSPAAQIIDVPMNESLLAADFSAANQLALATDQQNERVHALALKIRYEGSTDPAVLENSARDAIHRIGMGIFELGGYLLLMKEACGHGHFLPALERLGLGADVAQRYMSVTKRFSNTASTRYLANVGIQKLVEMLPLDDEQLDELSGLGQTGELPLDDVATMSVKQLRAAVRKVRIEKDRLKTVAAELNTEAVQLKLKGKVVALTNWPAALEPVTDQVAAAGRKLATALSELETCRITIFEHAQTLGDDARPSFEAALLHVAEVFEEALARAERGIDRERNTFDKTLGCFAPQDQ